MRGVIASMSILRTIYLFSIFLLSLSATVQEDAEDKKTSRWEILFSPTEAHVENYYDRPKKSRVIHFEGEGVKSIYKFNAMKKKRLKKGKRDKYEYWLSWEMQYKKDFVIILIVKTTHGESYLIYTSGNHNSYHQYGLGDEIFDGEWHTIKRNLQEDLDYFDNREQLLSIKDFVIKGDGSIDNLKTEVIKVDKQKNQKKAKPLPKPTKVNSKKNSLPSIKIEGDNPKHLALGENYVEAGVMAYDKEDGQVEVNSIDDINSNEDGTYMVMYMARDSRGDVSLDRRVVIVGDGTHQEQVEENSEESNEDKKDSLKEEELDEKEYQMKLWEKELELREKKLEKLVKVDEN